MPDHIHIAARLRPNIAPSVYVQKIKANSSKWINVENVEGILNRKFEWQGGGVTFSISRTHVEALRKYIRSQKEHHKKTSFKEEYIGILKKHNIDYEQDYLPEFFDNLY